MTETIIDYLKKWSERTPDTVAYRYLIDGEEQMITLTFSTLYQKIISLSEQLSKHHLRGKCAILMHRSDMDYVVSFYACLHAGVVAVPVYPPKLNRSLDRLISIMNDCSPQMILTTEKILSDCKDKLPSDSPILQLPSIEVDLVEDTALHDIPSTPNDIAFLQYTSGSTSAPKGVMINHRNIMSNTRMIQGALRYQEKGNIVGWLPLFHDMGIISNVVEAAYLGITLTFMEPAKFFQKPIRWLQAISKYGATSSGAPNFAFQLCVDKIKEEECQKLDLRTWKVAFNGSEPVRYETLMQFADKFSIAGFDMSAFTPCYGMAEATLMITGNHDSSPKFLDSSQIDGTDGKKIVSSGIATWDGQELIVVDKTSSETLSSYEIGEIWVKGNNISAGYWKNEEQTNQAFNAFTKDGAGPFFRTGDLGFLDSESELYVTGRIKDMMIVNGKNFYPQDIEFIIEDLSAAAQKGSTAAFYVEDKGVVCVIELVRSYMRKGEEVFNQLALEYRKEISQSLEIAISDIVFIKTNSALKTSSGKIQRQATKQRYLTNDLEVMHSTLDLRCEAEDDESLLDVKEFIKALVAKKAKISVRDIDCNIDISSYGFDSLSIVELSNRIEAYLQKPIAVELIYENATINLLMTALSKAELKDEEEHHDEKIESSQEEIDTIIPLFT